jgi:hypothetical protein
MPPPDGAGLLVPSPPTTSGYNIFRKENHSFIDEAFSTAVAEVTSPLTAQASLRLYNQTTSAMWKGLSTTQRSSYRTSAKLANAKAAREFEEKQTQDVDGLTAYVNRLSFHCPRWYLTSSYVCISLLEATRLTAVQFLQTVENRTTCIAAVYIAGLGSDNVVQTLE